MMMKGTHGTCVSRANLIKDNGFSGSTHGRRGSGAYFWGYTRDVLQEYARELARAWWRYALEKPKYYQKEKDQGCCVIYVTLETNSTDVLDFENQELRDHFFEYCHKTLPRLEGSDEEKMSTIYDMFINEIEEKLEKRFKIVHVKVQQPPKTKKVLPLDITGQPSCYVVKDLSCISVDDFEELDDE
ncbi:hypothetical protein [Vibrio vulnificus]|uniref:hypothetical protein n=2 Tax=Vibrio vulnificus TaxID=672 RepID=UPI003EDA25A7